MTTRRVVGTVAAAFVISQILVIAVHGFILAADYKPFYGTLLRPMSTEGEWRMLLLPVSHLAFILGLVWVYARIGLTGSTTVRGLTIGVLGWIMGPLPLYLLWYAEQPWPDSLVVKQLALELISMLLVGLTIAFVRRPAAR